MVTFKQFWQKIAERLKGWFSSPDTQDLKRGLAAISDENHTLQAELGNVRQLVAQTSDEGARKLADLQQRVELAESERNRVQQQIQRLQSTLHDAAARQETAETKVGELEIELKREHNKQLGLMQQVRDREHELGRRTGRTMWVAVAALLLGAMSSAAMMWGVHNNDRMLAELGRDIRDIRLSMTQQPARNLNAPLAEEFDAPNAVVSSPPVSVPETYPVQSVPDDRQDLLPDSSAVNTMYPGQQNRKYGSRKDAQGFFEENARQVGVVTLPSGLQYKILSQGNGRSPTASDRVAVNYRAFLLDGTEFDSSSQDPDDSIFTLDEVIPGWKEALLRMEEGAQWELYIPPDLAHKGGARKRGMLGYEPRVYVIELKSVIDADASNYDQ